MLIMYHKAALPDVLVTIIFIIMDMKVTGLVGAFVILDGLLKISQECVLVTVHLISMLIQRKGDV